MFILRRWHIETIPSGIATIYLSNIIQNSLILIKHHGGFFRPGSKLATTLQNNPGQGSFNYFLWVTISTQHIHETLRYQPPTTITPPQAAADVMEVHGWNSLTKNKGEILYFGGPTVLGVEPFLLVKTYSCWSQPINNISSSNWIISPRFRVGNKKNMKPPKGFHPYQL